MRKTVAPEMKKVSVSVCITVGELPAWQEFAQHWGGNSAAFRELWKVYRASKTQTALDNELVVEAIDDLERYLQEFAPAGTVKIAELRRRLNVPFC